MVKKEKKGTDIGTLIGLAIGGGAIIWLASQLKKAEAKKEEAPPTPPPPTAPPTPPSTPPAPSAIPREEPKVYTVIKDFYRLPPASVSPWDKPINLKRITGENKTISAREFVKRYTLTDMRNVQKEKKIDAPVFKFAQEAGLRPRDLVEQMKEGPSAAKAAEAKKVEAAKAKADAAAITKAKTTAGAAKLSTSLRAAVEKAAPMPIKTTYKSGAIKTTPTGYRNKAPFSPQPTDPTVEGATFTTYRLYKSDPNLWAAGRKLLYSGPGVYALLWLTKKALGQVNWHLVSMSRVAGESAW